MASGIDRSPMHGPDREPHWVLIADGDHIWPTPPHRGWIWKCYLRGIQPIVMDTYFEVLDGRQEFAAPTEGDAVLYLEAE